MVRKLATHIPLHRENVCLRVEWVAEGRKEVLAWIKRLHQLLSCSDVAVLSYRKTPEFKKDYKLRGQIERVVSG